MNRFAPDQMTLLSGALAFVALNALVALISYLFVVGRIDRVEIRMQEPHQ